MVESDRLRSSYKPRFAVLIRDRLVAGAFIAAKNIFPFLVKRSDPRV